MIIITHHDNQGCVTVCDGDNHAGIKLDCYTRGWDKPNYPMPSIPYEIQYDGPCLLIWDDRIDGEGKVINPKPVTIIVKKF